jgi:hypothetical protein
MVNITTTQFAIFRSCMLDGKLLEEPILFPSHHVAGLARPSMPSAFTLIDTIKSRQDASLATDCRTGSTLAILSKPKRGAAKVKSRPRLTTRRNKV